MPANQAGGVPAATVAAPDPREATRARLVSHQFAEHPEVHDLRRQDWYLPAMETERFFADLAGRLADARQADRRKYERFFYELAPRLDMARNLELELDRHLARRFNVFDYLRTDELGLSRIVADLLDPGASHAQGVQFLRALLERLSERLKQIFPPRPDLEACRISVAREQEIPAGRRRRNGRIDIVVRIAAPGGETCCLAIENKPYAGDSDNQIRDYLDYLERQYGERFVLIYMPPTGKGPSERSIDRKTLDEKWRSRFAIIAYREGQEERADEFDAYRVPFSVADWLGECRKICEAERVRRFLHDAEMFCQRTFGDRTMTTDSEAKAVGDFLLSNPDHLTVARAVYESWPAIKDNVCKRFLERLRSRIEQKINLHRSIGDIRVGSQYDGEQKHTNRIWLYRKCWTRCKNNHYPFQRTAIVLEAAGKGPSDWWICVVIPKSIKDMKKRKKKLRESLVDDLKIELGDGCGYVGEDWWAWWDWVDDKWKDWNPLLPELQRESEHDKGGEITNYFVDKFIEVAMKAIPVINKFERKGT